MRAIILASSPPAPGAGLHPPCMTPVAGRPLIHWQLAALREARVRDLVVVRGYRRIQVQAMGVRFEDQPTFAQGGEIDALAAVREELRGPVLVLRGDAFVPTTTLHEVLACAGNVGAVCRTTSALADPRFLGNAEPREVALLHLSPAGSDLVRELVSRPNEATGSEPGGDRSRTLEELLMAIHGGGTPVRLIAPDSTWTRGTAPATLQRAAGLVPGSASSPAAGISR